MVLNKEIDYSGKNQKSELLIIANLAEDFAMLQNLTSRDMRFNGEQFAHLIPSGLPTTGIFFTTPCFSFTISNS